MGSVWRARHTQLDVDMAVKVMSGELAGSTAAAERFKREARAAAMLRSPHVVQIHDYGVEDGQPYMVMELLAGEDLRAFIRRHGRVSMHRALQILAPVCKALRVAHEAGIIHRDIKPANVFLARSGGEEQVKVLDFGIAKAQHEAGAGSDTTSRLVLGSPMYMSPEQARGGRLDARSDLWSVAVVAYELVVGRQPFRGATLGDVFARICGDELPLPSAAGVCHPGLDDFFRRALARSPAARFPSAQALAEAFAALSRDHASAIDGDDDTERSPVLDGPAPASVSAGTRVERGMRTPLSVVLPIEPSPPARRGRESDTLALAASAPERTHTDAPAVAPALRRRLGALVGAGAAAGLVVVLLSLALPRLRAPVDHGDGASAASIDGASAASIDGASAANIDGAAAFVPPPPAGGSDGAPPAALPVATGAVAAPEVAVEPSPAPSQSPSARAAATARPAGSVRVVARPPAAAAPAASSAEAAPPPAAVPSGPRRDPFFGVPVTQP
jgi:serine/threonine-protein kinase